MLERLFILFIGIAIGVLVVMYHRWIVRMVGTNAWAEKIFGGGGTYTMWQLIGVAIVVLTVLYVSGTLDKILSAVTRMMAF